MALAPLFAIAVYPDSSAFTFYDSTGNSAPGGWGSGGNIAYSNSNIAEISIKDNLGNVIGALDTEYAYSLFNTDRQLVITPAFYAVPKWYDGVYEIIYTVKNSGGTVQGTYSNKVLFFSETETNLKNAILNMSQQGCGCIEKYADKFCVYRALLTAAKYMVTNNIYTTADTLIKQLKADTADICINC